MREHTQSVRHRVATVAIGLLSTALLVGGGQTAYAAVPPDDSPTTVPADEPERGLIHRGLHTTQSGVCKGLLVVASTGRCTHGPDAPPPGLSVRQQVAPLPQVGVAAAGTCAGDGVSGKRVQVLYVHPPGNDRFAQYKSSFEQWAVDMDTIFNESAKETGGSRHVRYVHNASCTPVVLNVAISSTAMNSFSGTISALKALGYNRTDRKYAMFADSAVYCGIGEFPNDDRKIATNRSNSGPHFSRTDSGCWGGSTLAHELGHNIGAVSYSAPNSSGGAHCTDEYDVMCYSDSPNYPPMRYVCPNSAHNKRLDCNHDDYYHTNPAAGTYLGTHWNVADSVFLIAAGTGPTPRVGPITSGIAGKCVDDFNNSSVNGSKVVLWDCNGGASQQWTVATDSTLRINGKCMDVAGQATGNGALVQIWDCSGGTNQQWVPQTNGSLKSVQSGRCLDDPGASTNNGTQLIIWDCHGGSNQKWTLP